MSKYYSTTLLYFTTFILILAMYTFCQEREEAPRVGPNGELTPLGWRWHRLYLSSARLEVASATSELFAGFVMLALVEMQINFPCTVPDVAWALFAANTTALVGLNIMALTATTCVLPDVSVIPRLAPCTSPRLLRESPHERLRSLVRLVWAAANFLGLALFFVEITLVAWVKFWDLAFIGAEISTWIGVPALLIFVGVASFLWRTLERHETQLVHEDAAHVERSGGSGPPSRHASQLQLDMLSVASHDSEDESWDENDAEGAWRCLHVALGKLEATNCMSELLAGFGTSATVELQTNNQTLVTPWLFAVLAVNTMLLVVVNLFTLMFATFLLPSMRALSESKAAAMLARGPHIRLRRWVAAAWSVTTLLGVLLFLTEVGVLCWVKFLDFSLAASLVSSLAVLLAALAYLAALTYFYCQHRQGLKTRRKKKNENLRSPTPSLRY
ncbi:hypothetical protein B566_EDAN004293 [Ephemera danica]|nr:hypothetical protein B566_EDAN004293 [Ephemera danica]